MHVYICVCVCICIEKQWNEEERMQPGGFLDVEEEYGEECASQVEREGEGERGKVIYLHT